MQKTNYSNLFNQELIMKKTKTNNVCKLLNFFREDSQFYFIYERAEMTLAEYMNKNTDASLSERINILKDIAQGLNCFHRNNIAHIDLKQDNIMKFGRVFKLIDLESSIDFNYNITSKNLIKSSLEIMPPEI